MTKEDKNLLMIDLCARLPYGVICLDEVQNETGTFKQFEYEGFGRIHNGRGLRYIENIKPYLRPLSTITNDEYNEYKMTIQDKLVHPNLDRLCYNWFNYGHLNVDWLNQHHFDYRGLIEKGMALEAPEGMYKISK